MAGLFNRGKRILLDGSCNFVTDTIRAMIVNNSYTFNPDHNVVSDVVAFEVSGSGYSRKDLTGKAAAQNDVNDRAELDADDVLWALIDAGTAKGIILFKFVTNDTDSPLIGFIDSGGFPVTTNGSDLEAIWAATGLLHGV